MRLTLAAALAALPLAADAAPVVFDFAAHALAEGEGPFLGMTVDGLSVTATTSARYVHQDAVSSRGSPPAGLGPCGITDCFGEREDGFGAGEWVTLTFSQPVRMLDMLLRETAAGRVSGTLDHTLAQGNVRWGPGGVDDVNTYLARDGRIVGEWPAAARVASDTWTWAYADGSDGAADFYITSATVAPIPLPGAAWLLLAGAGALGALRLGRERA